MTRRRPTRETTTATVESTPGDFTAQPSIRARRPVSPSRHSLQHQCPSHPRRRLGQGGVLGYIRHIAPYDLRRHHAVAPSSVQRHWHIPDGRTTALPSWCSTIVGIGDALALRLAPLMSSACYMYQHVRALHVSAPLMIPCTASSYVQAHTCIRHCLQYSACTRPLHVRSPFPIPWRTPVRPLVEFWPQVNYFVDIR